MIKPVRGAVLALAAASVAVSSQAQMPQMATIATPPQKGAIALGADGSVATSTELWEKMSVPGLEARAVRNVTVPTLTPYFPDPKKATGVAVIVAPGGAFRMLSIDLEGHAVAKWLAERGITAFVLKYRLVPTPVDRAAYGKAMAEFMKPIAMGQPLPDPKATPEALADGQAAVRLIRKRAAEWKIDPNKIGMIGYSAGAMTTLSTALAPEKDGRPDFIAPIYPPMNPQDVPADAPPMFLAIALDDGLFAKGHSLDLIESWRNAKRPLEVHLYEKGDHGFSMRPGFAAAGMVHEEFLAWMRDRGILKK